MPDPWEKIWESWGPANDTTSNFNEETFRKIFEVHQATGSWAPGAQEEEYAELKRKATALAGAGWRCKIEAEGNRFICIYRSQHGSIVRTQPAESKRLAFRAATRRAFENKDTA